MATYYNQKCCFRPTHTHKNMITNRSFIRQTHAHKHTHTFDFVERAKPINGKTLHVLNDVNLYYIKYRNISISRLMLLSSPVRAKMIILVHLRKMNDWFICHLFSLTMMVIYIFVKVWGDMYSMLLYKRVFAMMIIINCAFASYIMPVSNIPHFFFDVATISCIRVCVCVCVCGVWCVVWESVSSANVDKYFLVHVSMSPHYFQIIIEMYHQNIYSVDEIYLCVTIPPSSSNWLIIAY